MTSEAQRQFNQENNLYSHSCPLSLCRTTSVLIMFCHQFQPTNHLAAVGLKSLLLSLVLPTVISVLCRSSTSSPPPLSYQASRLSSSKSSPCHPQSVGAQHGMSYTGHHLNPPFKMLRYHNVVIHSKT